MAQSSPPIITSPDNFDVYYYPADPVLYGYAIFLTATNSPTWSGTTSWGTGKTITSYGEVSTPYQSPGTYTADVTASNSYGSASQHVTIRVHPAVGSFTTSLPNVYHPGETFSMTVSCNAPMTVTGSPSINLYYFKTHQVLKAHYISGSGTNALVFGYTVAATDATGDFGIDSVTPFDFGTGTISFEGLGLTQYMPLRYYAKPTRIDTTPPPPATKTDQQITFNSPVSAIVVGQPIALGATSSAGLPIAYTVISGDATISGNTLTPTSTATLVVRASSAGNDQVNPTAVEVNFGNPQKAAQLITASATTRTVKAGATVTLDAISSAGLPVSYTLVSGPAVLSGSTLTITGGSGSIVVRASQSGDATYNPASDLTLQFTIGPVPTSRLVNISSRLRVSANDANGASIAGFVVTGSSAKAILIRAVGPSLSTFGVGSPLAAPQLKLFDPKNIVIATNAGWGNDAQIAAVGTVVGAFPLGTGSKDAALLMTLPPGAYTTQVQSSASGTALIEVYDAAANATEPTKQLINISARGTVGTGDDVLIGGFVVSGDQPKRVLIRGIGPGLASFGVSGTLADPVLTIYDSKQAVVAKNDNWGVPQPLTPAQVVGSAAEITAADTAAGAFALQPGSADAAILVTLNPGGYSAVVTGANSGAGAAMVEIYEVPE